MQSSRLATAGRLSDAGVISPFKNAPTRLNRNVRAPRAILAPAEVSTRRQNKDSVTSQPGQSRGLAGALLAAVRVWERRDQVVSQADDLALQTAKRASENAKAEQLSKLKKSSPPPPTPDIHPFLRPVGVMELRYIRMLSNLCALTYNMDNVTTTGLLRRHNLRLVTSSSACDVGARQSQVSAYMAAVEGDAMAADINTVLTSQQTAEAAAEAARNSPAMQVVTKIEPLAAKNSVVAVEVAVKAPPSAPSATDVVAASLSAAAAAAAAAASSAAGTVASVAAPITTPIASNISAFTSSVSSSVSPLQSVASQLQTAATAGQSSAIATVATVSAAMESSMNRDRKARAANKQQLLPSPDCASPTHWFVADDDDAKVRMFVIQGSDNMDHWKVNLTFDPVAFEDPDMGIKVHRGVYEAARVLYDRFLPLVQDHLATSPTARVAFTGHSLGGSLGTLLMMMFVRRGVIDAANLAPVYTFGAPAIFCEGGCGGNGCALPNAAAVSSDESQQPHGALARLGLPQDTVRNVMMHKDIVPRAFACDYSLVSDILKRVHDSFREHKCLSGNRQVMFNFVGKVMVLQPPQNSSFVGKEGYHAMLPQRAGLYVVRDPGTLASVAAQMRRDVEVVTNAVSNTAEAISNISAMASSSLAASGAPKETIPSPAPSPSAKTQVASMHDAVWHLMNSPHPLDILADPGAYGDAGSISRYHNPDNYTRAIGGVLRSRGSSWQKLARNAKDAGVKFRPSVLVNGRPAAASVLCVEAPGGDHPHSPGGGKMQIPSARSHEVANRPSMA